MPKIVRMEDIIDIVGINNYVAALDLDIDQLTYLGSEPSGSKLVLFKFQYQEKKNHLITLLVDQNKNVKEVKCDCEKFDAIDYCSHIALVIMFFLTNESIIDEGLSVLSEQYDEEFNHYLFSKFTPKKKKRLRLEVTLRSSGFHDEIGYELIVKIGEEKLYVLKKQLENFLENYPEGEEEVYFGKNFSYRSSEYYVSKEDEKILDFLKFYVDSQAESRNYYGYYYASSKINSIMLSGRTLKEFLKLLEHYPFKVELGYYTRAFYGMKHEYPIETNIDEIGKNLRVSFHYHSITPLTEDYQYFMDEDECYHVSEEVGEFLKIVVENRKKQLLFKEEEFKDFSSVILPKIYHLNKEVKMTKEVEEKFILELPKVKYYFEKKKDSIIGKINLFIKDHEWNLFSEPDLYVMRDKQVEQNYIGELLSCGFHPKKDFFELVDEDDIISFLEEDLKKLTEKYEVYVSKNLKDVQIIKKASVRSEFGIGSDHILSYQFGIEGINKNEIKSLLDAVKLKKKYYRLKNGNYMNLESRELQKMGTLIDELELTSQQLLEDQVSISKYKSVKIERMVKADEMDFVKFDSSFENLIHNFNQFKDTKISLSKKDLGILRDYQEVGVKWLMTLSNCGFGGILADEMGLGKSIQTIKYIKLKLKENSSAKFLIVVPTSLIYNWEAEFEKFEPDISILLMNGNKEKRNELFERIDSAQVLITSYGLLRQDISEYQKVHFDTCIIDEAQNIKNVNAEITRACKMIQSDVKFALTGTPIENSILELWSIFDFIMPGYLSNLSKFKRLYSVKMMEESPEILSELNQQISPFILRRKKMDVAKDLPEKLENQVLVELDESEKKLYVGWLEKTKTQIEETLQTEGFMKSQILILSLLTKLRQICIDSRLLLEDETHVGSKIKTLLEILKGSISNGHKILVFSQFPSALHLVRQELDSEKITYYYLDGSTKAKRRVEMAASFNEDDTKVFLISLKAGGTGLNLTSADIVIHLDPWWNPQVENQATDRTHRIGQKNVVEVVKLIAKGTIEEKIIELQKKKKNLSDQVVEGENRDQIIISKLTEKELRNLLDS